VVIGGAGDRFHSMLCLSFRMQFLGLALLPAFSGELNKLLITIKDCDNDIT